MSLSSARRSSDSPASEFGIRWVPTIFGALLVIWGLSWIFAGGVRSKASWGMVTMGIVLLAVGVTLLRVGRRGISRSLRSSDQTPP